MFNHSKAVNVIKLMIRRSLISYLFFTVDIKKAQVASVTSQIGPQLVKHGPWSLDAFNGVKKEEVLCH